MIPQAASATRASQAGGLFMLGWGLVACTFGLSSLGALIFAVSTAMGQATIGFAAWAIGALPSLVLLTEDKPAGPGPGNVHD